MTRVEKCYNNIVKLILNPTIIILWEFYNILIQEHDIIGIIINTYYSKCLNFITTMEFLHCLFTQLLNTDHNFTFYHINVHIV